jgi:hypothetical protein
MFGPRGNPQARNLFSVIGYLQKRAGVQLHVSGWSARGGAIARRAQERAHGACCAALKLAEYASLRSAIRPYALRMTRDPHPPRFARRPPLCKGRWAQALGLPPSRRCERSEAIQAKTKAGLLRRHSASKTRVNALMAPRNDEISSAPLQSGRSPDERSDIRDNTKT